jgi:hypothetical protein
LQANKQALASSLLDLKYARTVSGLGKVPFFQQLSNST